MIKSISYQFPQATDEEKNFFAHLSLLLKELPSFRSVKEQVILEAIQPKSAMPSTVFETADISSPQVILDTEELIDLEVGNLYVRSGTVKNRLRIIERGDMLMKVTKKDAVGEYVEILAGDKTFALLSVEELLKRLKSHVVRIDHTGINIPTKEISKAHWDEFIQKIASVSNLYKYPTGEPWFFVLPATVEEHEENISDFPIGRGPKFEIVYDEFANVPTIQIDLESDLPRAEVEKLLPAPYGMSFPGVEDFFRSVYVDHPWSNLAIRFDVRFRSEVSGGSDWDTGKWLVSEGGRIS